MLTAGSIDNILMTFSIASYDKISSGQKVNEEKAIRKSLEVQVEILVGACIKDRMHWLKNGKP